MEDVDMDEVVGADADDVVVGQTGIWAKFLAWLNATPLIPLPFLGLGVYRAWLNVLFDRDLIEGFGGLFVSQNAFDVVMVASLIVCLSLAHRLTPLVSQRWSRPACMALLVCSTLCGYAAWWFPFLATPSLWACTVLGGVGTALVILLWSEAYGRLSPVRICLYYSVSLVVGAALGWVYGGIDLSRLPVMTCALPIVSIMCLNSCYGRKLVTPPGEGEWASFSFPWKPVLVVAIYSFSYGLLQSSILEVSRSNESAGTIGCALFVAAIIAFVSRKVDFGPVYGTVLPFMSAVFLILSTTCEWNSWARNLFANWGYTASQIFIMTMIGSICYRWGASAVWLFGIERSVRQVAMIAGRALEGWLGTMGIPMTPLLIVVVMAATLVALRESRLDSSWGMELTATQPEPERSRSVEEKHSLTRACAELSHQRNLSQREGEVLLLLAQHKTARDIEAELCVANGTAKAHIRHVYQKLDIHTREELFALVEEARIQKKSLSIA